MDPHARNDRPTDDGAARDAVAGRGTRQAAAGAAAPPASRGDADGASAWTRAERTALRDGDSATLARFYEEHFERIWGYVRRLVQDEHVAEDLTQEIFMHVQRSLATYDPARELRPWVYTIATNKVRDWWRSRRFADRRREARIEDDEGRVLVASGRRGPLEELESSELGAQLAAAVRELPESMGETFVLRWFEGLSFEDIGQVIDRNETAVRKRYSRALEMLRESLARTLGPAAPGGGTA